MKLQEQSLPNSIDAETFWRRSIDYPALSILDVRSPGEFESGHIPGAINVPLFTNEERAVVGTLYKQVGREPAILKGLEFAGARLAELVSRAMEHAVDGEVLVHCWRGGMRSNSFARILEMADLRPLVLDGGYKSFRKMAQASFEQELKLVIVSGLTGAGKTHVLRLLESAGEQVIDLEGLANHRGSSFGGIGQVAQPSTEQFENDLFQQIEQLDSNQTTWIEDEGIRIGSVVVPKSIHRKIQNSPAVSIDRSFEQRVENLVIDYGDSPADHLVDGIQRIAKRLGGLATKQAVTAVENGDLAEATRICLAYYDKTYQTAIRKMPREETVSVNAESMADAELISTLQLIAAKI